MNLVQTFIDTAQANIAVAKIPSLGTSQFFERERSVSDMKKLLQDTNNEKQQMEGLTMVLAAMSRGTNVGELFPDVAKLVASPNSEIKKLVYIFMVQYAEIEQDAALLAINILKRNSIDSNQMVRAHALRTISSFRVKMIIQVTVVAVSGGTKDSSPYVRKTAAHAIPKIYSVDPSQKEVLVECVGRLLKDRSPMVIGSAAASFNEICPDRFDLIHENYKKICQMLPDVDEWGQVSLINMLTRYARSQFVDPDKAKEKKDEQEDKDKEEDYLAGFSFGSGIDLDSDHRILLENALPLLYSRNSAVVMGVAMLYYYLAPTAEKSKVGKAVVRLVRNNRESQFCVLSSILAMANTNPEIFQPYLSEFFVEETDPRVVRKLKIEIMTLLSNEANIDRILREFTFYSTRDDKEFVAGTIQAIGKCAMRIPEVTDRCMMRLLQLLASKSPAVVAECVVVIKQLLQLPTAESTHNDDVIKQLTRLFFKVENPKAKAAIIWVVGEYLDKVGSYAPDILRLLAKDFISLDDTVKYQVLNLSAKLMVKNTEQTGLIIQYIFAMAKYDVNYDIRDRARLLRHILFPQTNLPILSSHMKDLFITVKPSPIPPSYDMRFMVGSLAQTVGHTTPCYNSLPEWSTDIKNAELRLVAEPETPVYNKYVGYGPTSSSDMNSTTINKPSYPQRDYNTNNLEDFLNGGDDDEEEEFWEEGEYDPEGEDGYHDEDYYGEEGDYEEDWTETEGGQANGYTDVTDNFGVEGDQDFYGEDGEADEADSFFYDEAEYQDLGTVNA